MSDNDKESPTASQNERIEGSVKSKISLQSLKEEVAALKQDLENPDLQPFQIGTNLKNLRNSRLSGASSKKSSLSTKEKKEIVEKKSVLSKSSTKKPTKLEKISFDSSRNSGNAIERENRASPNISLKNVDGKNLRNRSEDEQINTHQQLGERASKTNSVLSLPSPLQEDGKGVGKGSCESDKEEDKYSASSKEQSQKSALSEKAVKKEELLQEADVKQIELKGIMKEDVRKDLPDGFHPYTGKQGPFVKGSVVSRTSRIVFDPHVKKQEPRQSTGSLTSAYSTYSRVGKLKAGLKNLDGIGPFPAVSMTSYQNWKRTAHRSKMPNTYQLGPTIMFNSHDVKMIMMSHIKSQMERMAVYDSKMAIEMALGLAADIKASIRVEGYDRYRYCVLVSVGEKRMQGVHMDMRCLWDKTTDNYGYHLEEKSTYYVMALCCGVYKE